MNDVNCAFIDTWIDDRVAGRLPADAAARIDAHLAVCERCRRLETIVREATEDTVPGSGPQPAEADLCAGAPADTDLLDGVLARTSGNACAQAEGMLPALVDGELDAATRDVVNLHVEHCRNCSRLLAALEEAREILPALAEIEPPLGFTARVLARTSNAPRRSALAEWWLRLMAGPRASMELAYVGAILMVVVIGNPVSAFYGAEQHAKRLVGAVPVNRIAEELPSRVPAVGIVTSAVSRLGREVRAIGAELATRWAQAKALVASAWDAGARMVGWVRAIDWRHPITGGEAAQQPGNKAPPAKDRK